MSVSISSRLKHPKKHELVKSQSQAQILANKLRQDGVMGQVEGVMQIVDQVAMLLASKDPNISYKESIINLCQHLKVYGAYLDILFNDQLNHAFKVFRDNAQDDLRLDILSRLHLLEIIELRAKSWKGTDTMNQYYRKKFNQCAHVEASESLSCVTSMTDSMSSMSLSTSPPLLGPGEVIKPSGKFSKPTRIAGKKYCKDEVVIRNADSGKVMGIKGRRVHMIEELSETIISFQRVNPGAKERLVQITGANEESINHAKQLIEDTIRRNASPVREGMGSGLTGSSSSINSTASDESGLPNSVSARNLMHSMSTSDVGEYKFTVVAHGATIKISGDNLDLVKTSKLVLDEYFSGEPLQDMAQFISTENLTEEVEPEEQPAVKKSEVIVNGQSNTNTEPAQAKKSTLRKPHKSFEEIMLDRTSPVPVEKTLLTYSIEALAQLAMSPKCLSKPEQWQRISVDFPTIIRNVVESFNATQYLNTREKESTILVSSEDADKGEV